MTQEEIKLAVDQLSLEEMKSIVEVMYEPTISENHIARKLIQECLGEGIFVHTGILVLLPHISKRLLEMIDELREYTRIDVKK